jgi:hypothetical protein
MAVTMATFVLCASCLCGADATANLDFGSGTLEGWEGAGFSVARSGDGGLAGFVASSRDGPAAPRKGLLHRAVRVSAGARYLRCTASVVRGHDCAPDERLDVVVLGSGKRPLPRQARLDAGWHSAPALLSSDEGGDREYQWPLTDYVGQTVRIVLVDEDDRPGCYMRCGGFRLVTDGVDSTVMTSRSVLAPNTEASEFGRSMVALTAQHGLSPMLRFDSPHFTALSNAEEGFSDNRLRNCELIYTLFFDHFRRKGFTVHEPSAKLMVAMFDTQQGFEAYLGKRMPPSITGIYHPATNRFVMYDYGQNENYLAQKQRAETEVRKITSLVDRQRYQAGLRRWASTSRSGANTGTIMHEVAHQLSFNCGLLNRHGDVPLWLAEGLACYCESTADGTWQGMGEPNPGRLRTLAEALRGSGRLIGLRELIANDGWIKGETPTVLLGYAQSWALVRMLVENHPYALRTYLTQVSQRQMAERRLADFQQAFGSDLGRIERRYHEYLSGLVSLHAPAKR